MILDQRSLGDGVMLGVSLGVLFLFLAISCYLVYLRNIASLFMGLLTLDHLLVVVYFWYMYHTAPVNFTAYPIYIFLLRPALIVKWMVIITYCFVRMYQRYWMRE